MSRIVSLVVALTALGAATPAAAQDLEVEALARVLATTGEAVDVSGDVLQVYKLPISFTLRDHERRGWGLRLMAPVSFGAYELSATTGIGDLFERIRTVTVTPGLEALLPVGSHWLVKPFAEAGVGGGGGDAGTEVVYAAGVRAVGTFELERWVARVGTSARYASPRSRQVHLGDYTTIELGADWQRRLSVRLGDRELRAGVYGVTRVFPDLDLPEGLEFREVHELGFSCSTDPVLRLWKLRLPWIGLGYRFGDLFTGVRLSLSFPF